MDNIVPSILEENMSWLAKNYQWIFSGIGVTILTSIITILLKNNKGKRGKNIEMRQKSGDNSLNIQIGGDINNDK
jgi:hypothetical protein